MPIILYDVKFVILYGLKNETYYFVKHFNLTLNKPACMLHLFLQEWIQMTGALKVFSTRCIRSILYVAL